MKVVHTGTEVGMGCSRKVMTGWVSADRHSLGLREAERFTKQRGRETETHRGESCGQKDRGSRGVCRGASHRESNGTSTEGAVIRW